MVLTLILVAEATSAVLFSRIYFMPIKIDKRYRKQHFASARAIGEYEDLGFAWFLMIEHSLT